MVNDTPYVIAQIVATPVEFTDVTNWDDQFPQKVPGRFDIELAVVTSNATLEDAHRWLREGTRFRLVEVSDE